MMPESGRFDGKEREGHSIKPEKIRSISLSAYPTALDITDNNGPKTVYGCKFSGLVGKACGEEQKKALIRLDETLETAPDVALALAECG